MTGNDRDLDALLVRLHVETACRRGGALALRTIDLDPDQCLIRLREMGEADRWQPVSPTLMRHLIRYREDRGDGDPHDQLLRYHSRRPITRRRYDHLWNRLGENLPWVAAQQISTHWLRYTTLTWIERNFGYAVARAYAGHNGRTDFGTTATYVRADLYEVALRVGHPQRRAPSPGIRRPRSTAPSSLHVQHSLRRQRHRLAWLLDQLCGQSDGHQPGGVRRLPIILHAAATVHMLRAGR